MIEQPARLFLALWPDTGVRSALAGYRDTWRWNAKASVVSQEELHLTLHFIGKVQRNRLSVLREQLRLPCKPFDMHFGSQKLWRHDVAILRPASLPDRLLRLHAALRESLQHLDLPVDARDFQPHVTLARRANGAVPPVREPEICWHVDGYALVESRLRSKAKYVVVETYSCGH